MDARGGCVIGSGVTTAGGGSGSSLNSRMPQQRTAILATNPGGRAAPTSRVIPPKAANNSRAPLSTNNSNGDHTDNTIVLHKLEEMDSRLNEMILTVDSIQRERDFYYKKFHEIEVLCQSIEPNDDRNLISGKILEILYATEEGFADPEDNTFMTALMSSFSER